MAEKTKRDEASEMELMVARALSADPNHPDWAGLAPEPPGRAPETSKPETSKPETSKNEPPPGKTSTGKPRRSARRS